MNFLKYQSTKGKALFFFGLDDLQNLAYLLIVHYYCQDLVGLAYHHTLGEHSEKPVEIRVKG